MQGRNEMLTDTNIYESMPGRVLVVEDDDGLRKLIEKTLRKAGYDAAGAPTGAEGMAHIKANKDIVLLLDQNLPDMNGSDFIISLIESGLRVPFIVMTGQGNERLAVEMMKLGAADYLVKDLDLTDLLPGVFHRLFQKLDTERRLRAAEEALQESEEKFRNFTDQSLVGIYLIQDGVFKYVNPKFSEIFGYTVAQCLCLSFDELVYPEDRDTVEENIRKRISGEVKTVHYEFRGIRKNSEIVHLEIFGSSILFNGESAATGTLLDITERKNAEKEKAKLEGQLQRAQKMESIGSLAGGIAHDLNNILFPISGLSEMLLDEISPDNPAHESLEQIHKSAQRSSDLVKQILAFSRQSNPRKLPILVQPILKEVLKLSRAAIPMNIEIASHIDTDCGMVSANSTQVHQIAMNLITNAYHAVEQTGGTIHVELKEIIFEKDELSDYSAPEDILAGKYACIIVSDTGTGIDNTLIHKIFDPYFTTKEQGKGTGLGLSVVHGIVKDHDGDIRVYSEVGKGTTFKVYLPLQGDIKDKKAAAIIRKYPTGCESILLVDDEEPIAQLVKMMLEKLGYRVTVRLSSPDALDAFRANPDKIDLVISDRSMPNMTGEQLAREIISIKPGIPIIICTGFSDKNDEQRGKSMGIKGFLMKPVATGDLAEMVRKALDEIAECM